MASNFFAKREPQASSSSAANGSTGTSEVVTKHLPWVEKYRPKTVQDVAFQDEVTRTLEKSITTGNLPHLLFYGPPGTGKTSTILAIARQMYGSDYKQKILELNASDERGIHVIRSKVKEFAQMQVRSTSKDHPSPSYKLIILDEADSMTSDAQAALRRTIEQYSRVTRFCLICNYVSRIIEPLASRCAKFRFKPLPANTMVARLKYISENEGIQWNDEVGNALVLVCGGDMRRAITLLQSGYRLEGSVIPASLFIELSGLVPAEEITGMLEACKSNSFDRIVTAVQILTLQGYSAAQIVAQLAEKIIESNDIGDPIKARICIQLAETDQCLTDGADEYLQLMRMCAVIMQLLASK